MENLFNFQTKIEYKINKNKKDNNENSKIKIFNEEFVKNNEPNFKMVYNGKESNLTPFLEISSNKLTSIVEIVLHQTNEITNLSGMFYGCDRLYSCSSLSKLNVENVIDISGLFRNCINILKLPDISNWNTSNVNNMSYIFSGCNSLYSLPDISKWNTSNVTDFSYMFYGCKTTPELPDISKWDTSKGIKMNNMFQGCSTLKKLPDISKWDVGSVTNMSFMFYGCQIISSLPDISIWDTKEVVNMSSMFYLCSGLNSLPDLDKWNVLNLKKYSFMFAMCKPTLNIPAFSRYSSQALNSNNSCSVPRAETQKNVNIKKTSIYSSLNPESLNNSYSKNYLCCPQCKGIPEMFIKNNEIALLTCDYCGFDENIPISDILNASSKWIGRVFYNCNIHKEKEKAFANKFCLNCNILLCKKCESNHTLIKEDEEHELEFICDLDTNFCEKHSSIITKFCQTCSTYICNICIKNEHKAHNIKTTDKNEKLNFDFLKKYYLILNQGKHEKIRILEKIEKSFGEDELDIKYQLLQFFKKDLKDIEDFKKLGKIIYFSSKKIKPGNYKEKIIDNYISLFNYIISLSNDENIKIFRKLVQEKIDEFKIISKDLSKTEKNFLDENITKIFEPIQQNVSDFQKKKTFIENNIDYSRILKKHIIIEKNKNFDNYIDKEEILNDFKEFSYGIKTNNSDVILSLLGKCVENNGTEVYITKKASEDYKNLELASTQSLFSLGTQKKYELHFNFNEKENEELLNSPEKQEMFINIYKPLITKELNIDEKNLILKDFHRGCVGVSCSQVESSENSDLAIQNLQGKFNIEKINEKPLLEALQISSNILDPEGNRSSGWGVNETRGGEAYIPPLNDWKGYGLKVSGLYDNGNNNWLNYNNNKGEFAIAYMGINNFLGETDKMISNLNDYSQSIKKLIKNRLYRGDDNCRNKGAFSFLFDYKKCGDGVCLFQNPEYAENSAGIINVCGYQIKVILMCRVNPKKIRQPVNFRDCWILNPTPDEIRPYRILIKIIPDSPLTDGSFLTVSMTPVDYVSKLFKSKDYSFYKFKNDEKYKKYAKLDNKQDLDDEKFAIKIYTANGFYRDINCYLRDKDKIEKSNIQLSMPIDHIKSFIFCLQEALRKNKNVKDGTIVYRGIKKIKLANNIGIGSKFYFREFISTSIDEKVGRDFIRDEGTLFKIKIKNNKRRNYCYYVGKISAFPNESEILISSFCYYVVTEIKRIEGGIDLVNLDCLGFLLDE